MRFFSFLLFFFLMVRNIFMYQYYDIFFYNQPILTLLNEENFIKHFSKKRNFQIKKEKDFIEISYIGKKFGYEYKSYYKIIKKINSFEVFYKNQYLENKIIVEGYKPSYIQVKTDTKTYIPIPHHILRRIIRSRVRSLFLS